MTQPLKEHIRNVPDFPRKGIVFRDITPLLADGKALAHACATLAEPFRNERVELVVGAESRGFIFGVGVARELDCGFVPVRKPGKLPSKVIAAQYELEYGSDTLEMHTDAIRANQRVLLVDDLLATGGTMQACCRMVRQLDGLIVGIAFLIELAFLGGRSKLGDYHIHSVISYDCE